MSKYKDLATNIIKNIGGKENVKNLTHCITRLRFQLNDESIVNTSALKEMDGIITIIQSGGQYQVVIGNHVADVFNEVNQVLGITIEENVENKKQKKYTLKENIQAFGDSLKARGKKIKYTFSNPKIFVTTFGQGTKKGAKSFISTMSAIFIPILPFLIATGLIQAILTIVTLADGLKETDGAYIVLDAISKSVFYFMPIFIAFSATKKFGGSMFIGVSISAVLVMPGIIGLAPAIFGEQRDPLFVIFPGSFLETPVFNTFLGIPIIGVNYTNTVIPAILASYLAVKLEKGLNKVLPVLIKYFLTPTLILLFLTPVILLTLGPVTTWLGLIITEGTFGIFNFSPILAGIVIGFIWQFLVVFGIHWAFVPFFLTSFFETGQDAFLPLTSTATMPQTFAVLAVMLKTKDLKLKQICGTAFVSGIFGITEPALYGVTVPRPKLFILTCIGGAIGGAIKGGMGSMIFAIGAPGLPGITATIPPDGDLTYLISAIVSIVVSAGFTFFVTLLIFSDNPNNMIDRKINEFKKWFNTKILNKKNKTTSNIEIERDYDILFAPISGELVELQKIEDKAFASEILGKGIAIKPSVGQLYAPCDGRIKMLFPTLHAIAIEAKTGEEILIHIGLNTVSLNGKYFEKFVNQGDDVKKGDLLIKFDIDQLKKEGYDLTTPVIITNYKDYKKLNYSAKTNIEVNSALIKVSKI